MNVTYRVFSILVILFWASTAMAGSPTSNDYIGVGFNPPQAELLAEADISSFDADTTYDNVIGGDGAGDSITTGTDNVLLGDQAGTAVTTGADNICVGEDAGLALTTGADNVLIGEDAGTAHAGTNSVIGIGASVMDAATAPGDGTVCIGEDACGDSASFAGADTIAVGQGAAGDVTTGAENIFIGGDAGATATTAANNIGIGHTALGSTGAKSGADNICIGEDACKLVTSDAQNVCIGSTACDAIVGGGNDNVALGNAAASAVTTGDGNVCIGDETCAGLTTHGKNIQIGFEVGKSAYAAAADKLLIANSDDATPLIDGTMTAGSESLTLNVPRNLRVRGNGNVIKTLTVTDVNTQNDTMTVAEIVTGIYVHTSVTGGGTITTDTAANIIAGATSVGALTADNDCYQTYYINDGDQTVTFAGGDSVTVADTGQTIAENESAILLWCRATDATVKLYIIGG